MSKRKKVHTIQLEHSPTGAQKGIGGSNYDAWNARLATIVASAMPVNQSDMEQFCCVATAGISAMADLKPADPIEAILMAQLVVANEAALSMYRRAWSQPSEYFDARCRYLALANKAQRTVTMLTERLDHHRGRGQQQITVKHVTVNADQAVVGNINAGGGLPSQSKEQPHAIAYAAGITMPSQNQAQQLMPIAGDAERPLPDARRKITGRSKGK